MIEPFAPAHILIPILILFFDIAQFYFLINFLSLFLQDYCLNLPFHFFVLTTCLFLSHFIRCCFTSKVSCTLSFAVYLCHYITIMASSSSSFLTPVSQFQSHFNEPHIIAPRQNPSFLPPPFIANQKFGSFFFPRRLLVQFRGIARMPMKGVIVSGTTAEKPKKRYPGESKGFVEEMRFVAMKLHTREQAKEGEKQVKEPEERSVAKWEPTIDGYLRFLVDSMFVYDKLEKIIQDAAYPSYAEFRNTGLERTASLAKDLEWFREEGHIIPAPSSPGLTYAQYLKELSEKDPQAFICHFYNIYFAHTAGGRMIGKKVAEKILNKKELEFYKWDGDLSQLLQNVKDKLNKVAEGWTREEKNHCLEETQKSFKLSGEVLRLILS